MFDDFTQIPIEDFKGLWDTGNEDSCPINHLLSAQNVRFGTNEVFTREGSTLIFPFADIVRIHLYKRIDEASRFIILDESGRFFDSLHPEAPFLNIPECTDFSMVNFFNRAYISPHNGIEGLPNEHLYVYDGSTLLKAGSDSAASLTATNSTLSGDVSPGVHYFAVAYETATGFISKPGPAFKLATPGGQAVNLTIPVGPPGTVKRHIVATEGIPEDSEFVNDPLNWEFFRLETVPNNIDTELTVNFFDTELIESADYLFDQMDRIPAGVALTQYAGRLVIGGADGENSVVRISRKFEPESFDAVSGFVIVDPTEAGGVKAAVEFRETLYIFKSHRTYATTDDQRNAPALWNVVTIDKGAGTEVFGVSTILDAKGTTTDKFLIADRSGLLLYDGFFHRPELTWKVSDFWDRIYKESFQKVQVLNDPITKSIYILCNQHSYLYPDTLLHGNYDDGLDPESIRWSIWLLENREFRSGLVDIGPSESQNTVLIIGADDGILQFDSTEGDAGEPIRSSVETAKLRLGKSGDVGHFTGVRLRIVGTGILGTSIFSEDDVEAVSLRDTNLSALPGKEAMQWCNFINEQASFKFSMFGEEYKFRIFRITAFCKTIWDQRVVR